MIVDLRILPDAVDRAAADHPEREAVRYIGKSLSYALLAERSERLASLLRARGIRRGDRVAIHAGKGLDATVAMYGIMKAGAAVVPLNVLFRAARSSITSRIPMPKRSSFLRARLNCRWPRP